MAQDSSKADFWETRYQKDVTPWDSAGLPAGFVEHASALLASGHVRRVLIPGCGSAYELQQLAGQGCDALAFDFSPAAVARARAACPALTSRIIEADFFGDAIAGAWDWVYERAFLCALPPALADRYAQRMAELIPAGGVLAGYFFLRDQAKGPPFGTSLFNLQQSLGPYFMLQKQVPIAGSLPVFHPDEHWLEWVRLP
ncbi:SAM-dependent methyltransferase [Vogesella mureinivorans]|uniref:SAM-dependent methyltransferase n=1 Tax=Vogesella mureinivorans TaxID=657276 RepID=UPI0014791A57|nr:SAM-dependent methyltransferase [Vogesella mureinivorans]